MFVLPLAAAVIANGSSAEVIVPGRGQGVNQVHPLATLFTQLAGTAPSATVVIEGRPTQTALWAPLETHTYVATTGAQATDFPVLPFLRVTVSGIAGVGATVNAWAVIYEDR